MRARVSRRRYTTGRSRLSLPLRARVYNLGRKADRRTNYEVASDNDDDDTAATAG